MSRITTEDVLYDRIGAGYNSTRQADPFLTEKLFYFLSPRFGELFLDLGCGTGNYTVALANKGLKFYGIEPSEKMLAMAKLRNIDINWLLGCAEDIPVADHLFDGVIATLTIHHWQNLNLAFREIKRVLIPGAKIILFTASPEQMRGYWLNHYFPQMLGVSALQMPPVEKIKDAAEDAGLKIIFTERYFIRDDLEDHFLYSGKNKPHIYLDEHIRNGISSFSSLANAEEIEAGLKKLREDIDSNSFEKIRAKYNDNLGDYLFIGLQC